MSAAVIYKPSAGTFDSIPLSGLVDVTVSRGASKTKTRADGALAYTKAYGEGFTRTVTVRCESNVNLVALTPAMVGRLSFTLYQQADGSGPVSGGAATLNFPATASTGYAYLDNISDGLPFEGKPTVNYTFDVIDAAGDPTLLEELVT